MKKTTLIITAFCILLLAACSSKPKQPKYGLIQDAPQELSYDDQLELGKKIYLARCYVCHANGSGGAPKIKDDVQWQKRGHKDMSLLITHVTNGYKLMPAKGECIQCSPQEIRAAITYMLSLHNIKPTE